MGLFKKFFAWLTTKPVQAPRKWDPHTNPIDVAKIAAQLRLQEEGARLGAAGIPLDTATELSAPETQAVLAIEQARTDYVEWAQYRVKSLDSELTRLDITTSVTQALGTADAFQRSADADLTGNATELQRLAEIAQSRQQAFDEFRRENRRSELPHYPQGLAKTFKVVLAIFLMVVDGAFNAGFFATGLSGGLIEGFFQATMAAVANVTICLLIGLLGVRAIHHRHPGMKVLGAGAFLLGLSFTVALGLMVSHYREALLAGLETAQSAGFQSFLQAPWSLNEISSWILFVITVLFGMAAMADGHSLDDPYPGYGRMHRRLVQAQMSYSQAISGLQDHLNDLKEKSLSQISQALEASENAIVRFKNVVADKERSAQELTNAIGNSSSMLGALLAIFRTENAMARKAGGYGTPPSFATVPTLKRLTLPDFDTSADRISLQRQLTLFEDLVAQAPEVRARIQAAYNLNFSTVQTLHSQFAGQGEPSARADTSAAATGTASMAMEGS